MNLQKMQMVGIQYTWYGAGFVDYMVRAIDGKMIMLHRSKGNNINDEAYMRTGNLPARYQASNKGPRTWVSKPVDPSATEIQLYNVTEFPAANASYPVTVQIDNELIQYTGVWTANGNITGLTRGATLSNYVLQETRGLWQGTNAGAAWQDSGMPVSANWASQAFNPSYDNNKGIWVAVSGYGSAGQATAYSYDGHTWFAGGNLPVSSTWVSVAYGKLNGVDTFVAVSNTSGTISAYSQDNGLTWTSLTLPATAQWSSVAYGLDANNVGVFVAVAGLNSVSTSTAKLQVIGTGWVSGGALPASQMWTSVAFGKTTGNVSAASNTLNSRTNFFVAVGAGSSMTTATAIMAYSSDGGITWYQGAVQSATYACVAFGNNTWMAVPGGYGGSAGTAGSYIFGNPALATWAAMTMPTSTQWRSIAWGPIYSMNPGASTVPGIGIGGQWFAVSETSGTAGAYVTNPHLLGPGVAPTWVATTMPSTGVWTSVCWGKGIFTSTINSLFKVAVSTQGNTFVTTDLTIAGNWQGLAYGAGNLVAPQFGGTSVQVSYNGGRQWQAGGALASSSNWVDVAYGPYIGRNQQGRFVAISNTSGTVNNWQDADNLGATWIAGGALPTTATWSAITYVNNAFVAVATGSQTSAFSPNAAIGWSGINLPSSSNWSGVAAGIFPAFAGNTGNVYCVAAISATSGTTAAYSNVRPAIAGLSTLPDSGQQGQSVLSLWGSSTLPATAAWQAIAYGYDSTTGTGRFIAIGGSSSQATAISTDGGRTWTGGGNLPSASNWYKIAYGGNNVWVAISNSRDTKAAYSRDHGVTWVAATLPVATNWTDVEWHPQFNQFVAISGDATNASANIAISLNTGGIGAAHTANTGVKVVSVTASPDLNHWGSAVIMDGGFTVDRTYTFTYNVVNYAATGTPHGLTNAGLPGAPNTVFLMRLAPSISNSLTGELGTKELINRAQVLLNNMYINIASTGARFLLQGILNPTNIASANWRPLNAPANYLQPSFTQFVANNIGVYGAGTQVPNITYVNQGNAATGGEQLFSIPVSQGTAGFLDLSQIKEITSMVLPGSGLYPNGNEILAINLVPASSVGNATNTPVASNVDIQVTFIESQA
jgi:hypothetical protein